MGLIRSHVEILQARELTLQRLPCLGVCDIVGPTGFNSIYGGVAKILACYMARESARTQACNIACNWKGWNQDWHFINGIRFPAPMLP
jgi:hypothetical protein